MRKGSRPEDKNSFKLKFGEKTKLKEKCCEKDDILFISRCNKILNFLKFKQILASKLDVEWINPVTCSYTWIAECRYIPQSSHKRTWLNLCANPFNFILNILTSFPNQNVIWSMYILFYSQNLFFHINFVLNMMTWISNWKLLFKFVLSHVVFWSYFERKGANQRQCLYAFEWNQSWSLWSEKRGILRADG